VVASLKIVLKNTKHCSSKVLIENTAGQGTSIGYKFEHLRDILNGTGSDRVGVCFDTCHAFAAGYDLRTKEAFESTWKTFDAIVGITKLKAIHLNDSKGELGSRVDRHDHIGHGQLGLDTFRWMMEKFPDVPKVLETEKDDGWDRINLDVLLNK
jgi:deoxyribonuclease-4